MTAKEAAQALKVSLASTPGVLGVVSGNFGVPQLVVYTNTDVVGLPVTSNGFPVRQQKVWCP